MFDPEYGTTTTVHVASIGLEGDSFVEVAPLIDALDHQFMSVGATRSRFEPPLAGAGPTVLLLVSFVQENKEWIKSGLGFFAAGFLTKMGSDSWDGVRSQLAKAVRRKKPESDGAREYALLVVQIERVRFVFDETLDKEEFERRLAAAAEYAKTLPDAAFRTSGPPDHDWYYWNPVTKAWQGGRDLSEEERREIEQRIRDNPKHQARERCKREETRDS